MWLASIIFCLDVQHAMCAADTIHSLPAKLGITTKVSKKKPTNPKCLSDFYSHAGTTT